MQDKGKGSFLSGLKKSWFLTKSRKSLSDIYNQVYSSKPIKLDELVMENPALIIVDMVNGFVKEGALASKNVLDINEKVADLAGKCESLSIPIVALADCHSLSSPEFEAYPQHCLEGSVESAVTDEIAAKCHYTRIEKNSTNGFLSPEFREWLSTVDTDTFVLVGDCTDICITQLACTMKAYYNQQNRYSRVIVPISAVATYDLGVHNARLTSLMALYSMTLNGVELCSDIEY